MKIFSAKVTDGKIELPPDAFPEGSEVTVVSSDAEPFQLTPEEVTELRESLEQVQRGKFVDGDEFLQELRWRRRP